MYQALILRLHVMQATIVLYQQRVRSKTYARSVHFALQVAIILYRVPLANTALPQE